MKRKFKMENLDCAHCAAKMEDAIKNIPGVLDVSMNFMMQKLTLEIEEEANIEKIIEQAQECCSKIESDCKIVK